MSMFDKYADTTSSPNNIISKVPEVLSKLSTNDPVVTYDLCGNVLALSWDSQDRFRFNLTTDFNIVVSEDSIILTEPAQAPAISTGRPGIYAYNVVDRRCWKRTPKEWRLLPKLEYPSDGTRVITFRYQNQGTLLQIRNFREEVVAEFESSNNTVTLVVDDHLAGVLKQGSYNMDILTRDMDRVLQVRRISVTIGGQVDIIKDKCELKTGKYVEPAIYKMSKHFNHVIGDIHDLKTAEKDNLVDAINFVYGLTNDIPSPTESLTWFDSLSAAEEAARQATEITDSSCPYYYGQKVLVDDGECCCWYTIQRGGTLEAEGTGTMDSVEVMLEIDGDLYEFANAEEPELIEGTDTYSVTINQ